MLIHTKLLLTLMINCVSSYAAVPYETQTDQDVSSNPPGDCQCALFLVTDNDFRAEFEAYSSGEKYNTSCDAEKCAQQCDRETQDIEKVFSLYPEALLSFPPNQSLSCGHLPARTATFYSTCGAPWTALLISSYTDVCCHPLTGVPAWCKSIPDEVLEHVQGSAAGIEEGRGLDLQKSPDDIENNEIDGGSSKPEKYDSSSVFVSSKPTKGGATGGTSWLSTLRKYLAYLPSVTDVVKDFDGFPTMASFREVAKTYKDEMHMGQCFMEFTTYSVFTKGENPFNFLTRGKREAGDEDEWLSYYYSDGEEQGAADTPSLRKIENARYASSDSLEEITPRNSQSKQAQIETIKSLVGGMVSFLERTETTRNYAKVIKQLLPFVTNVYAAEDPQQAVSTLVSLVLGPYLDKKNDSKPKPEHSNLSKKKEKLKKKNAMTARPGRPNNSNSPSNGPTNSPIGNAIFNMASNYLTSYLKSTLGVGGPVENNSIDKIDIVEYETEAKPVQASQRPSGLLSLAQMFLGEATREKPTAKPTTTKKPDSISEKQEELLKNELARPKDFVDAIMEFIRPIFVSIFGRTPGDSGVASIRRVSRLSVLGRVDNELAEEVLSPYFCIKLYGVNKAWTLTERVLRNFSNQLTLEERETVRAFIT